MRLWLQAVLAFGLTLAATAAAAVYVPAAALLIDRIGLGVVFDRLGIVSAEAAETAARGAGQSARGGPSGPIDVAAVPPRMRPASSSVAAIGTVRSVQAVTVSSEVAGRIVRTAVRSGDRVEAGALIAELDSEFARIELERAGVGLAQAQAELDRIDRLRANGAGTQVQRDEAEFAMRQAELAQREAAFVLGRHSISAPIGGWVGIVDIAPGRLVAAGEEIARIEDRSSLLVDFRVPERVASLIKPGAPVAAAPLSDRDRMLNGRIVAVDNRVDAETRSLAVQASIDNSSDLLRAGMAIGITLDFVGDPKPAVDPLAIQWGSDGSYVWAVRDGKVQRLPVRVVQRESDAVLVEAAFEPGDLVVTEGVQSLRPGTEVSVVAAGN